MKFLYFIQDTFKKTLGLVLIIPGLVLLLIATVGIIGDKSKSENLTIGIGVAVFSLVMIIPGIMVYRSGQKQSKEEMKVRELVSILSTYRRITLADMGSKIGVTEAEAQRLLNLAIDQRLTRGFIDRTTGEFFVSGSIEEIKNLSKCPFCGAPVAQIFHTGETAKCQNCGSLFQ